VAIDDAQVQANSGSRCEFDVPIVLLVLLFSWCC